MDRYHELGLGFGGIQERDLTPCPTTLACFLGLAEDDPLLFPPFFASKAWLARHGFHCGRRRLEQQPSKAEETRVHFSSSSLSTTASLASSEAQSSSVSIKSEVQRPIRPVWLGELPGFSKPEVQKFEPRLCTGVEAADRDSFEDSRSYKSCDEESQGHCLSDVDLESAAADDLVSAKSSVSPASSNHSQDDTDRAALETAKAAEHQVMRHSDPGCVDPLPRLDSLRMQSSSSCAEMQAESVHASDIREFLLASSTGEQKPVKRRDSQIWRPDWWDHPRVTEARQLESAVPFTRAISVQIAKASRAASRPWSMGNSLALYEDMGVTDPSQSYVAFWLNFGPSDIVSVSEVIDQSRLEACLANDPFGQRLKLILSPVKLSLPFPSKGAKDAEFVGRFFDKKSLSISRSKATCGAPLVVVQVDLFSKWLIKTAMSKVGFRLGNTIEILLMDWVPGRPAALAAYRLTVTEEFQRLYA